MELGEREIEIVRMLTRALVRHRGVFWAGASRAEPEPRWFATVSHDCGVDPPELGPDETLEQQPSEACPSGGSLFVVKDSGASYRMACGLLMPHELVVAVVMDRDTDMSRVLKSLELTLTTLASALPRPDPDNSGPPTPPAASAWLPVPRRRVA